MNSTIPTIRSLSPSAMLLLSAACSTFPSAEMPPYTEHQLEIRWAASPEARAVRVPASDETVTVYRLEIIPAPLAERFEEGTRYLTLPPGTEVTARCRLRAWNPKPDYRPESLFPGAASVNVRP